VQHQSNEWSCGPAAVQNALLVHHKKVSQAGLRALCGTTEEDGTDEQCILRALLAYECEPDEWSGDVAREAEQWLGDSLRAGRPTILCVDRWEHWVTVIGTVGRQIVLFDPARGAGASVLRWPDFRRRWEAGKRDRGRSPRFYGIAVGAP
jgi:ABC-type bacteriocin/lantibiotic exporter with double-glycine peptidase domain